MRLLKTILIGAVLCGASGLYGSPATDKLQSEFDALLKEIVAEKAQKIQADPELKALYTQILQLQKKLTEELAQNRDIRKKILRLAELQKQLDAAKAADAKKTNSKNNRTKR